MHRRHEMEDRISTFTGKCDQAINNIRKLKAQARTFVNQLNCEPPELKERFLSCMKRLDEYIYLMTEFNLSIDNFEKNDSMEVAPVQDNSYKNYPVLTPTNLMDVLSEPAPTASTACANMCPEKPARRRPKAEQLLIEFSSTSCSAESVPGNTVENEVQHIRQEIEHLQHVTQETEHLTIIDPKVHVTLPRQPVLDTDRSYEATVMFIDGHSFWIAVDQTDVCNLVQQMTEYYSQEKNRVSLSLDELPNFTCCVYHDTDDTDAYFRAMFLKTEASTGTHQVFLVDTGELRPVTTALYPLMPRFRAAPPKAHCSHLADVEFLCTKKSEIENFLNQFVGNVYTMKIDDNVSESLGVYLFLDEENTINELVVQEGLATALDKPARPAPAHGPPDTRASSEDLDYCGPEHENPVEAVTGYNNRDEFDICKHYKGGSEKTCFKGAKCKKRHVVKHPDGWTLDRVAILKCRPPVLPPPGTWHKVVVTYVAHFDRLYVHFQQDVTEELPSFGRVLPPSSLAALVRDMNSPATYAAFKPLQSSPAPGELVAAKYRDGLWYRARVNGSSRADQNVEVMYIDYGNVVPVKENEIMQLERRFAVLPAQAVRCRLAGVSAAEDCGRSWAEGKRQLAALAQDKGMEAHVISRDFDELTVELRDADGNNLAEQLAARGVVCYDRDYEVEDDSHTRCKLVQA